MRVIFMGTPEFSVPALQAIAARHQVVAAYSQPPRMAGRGQKPRPSPVQRAAEALGIPTVALAGTIGKGARQTYEHGIGAYASIMQRPCSLRKAIGGGAKLLRQAAENTMRMLLVGQRLAQRERA